MASVPWLVPAMRAGVVVAVAASALAVWWLDRHRGWGDRRRSRLLLGVPWGTLVVVAGVLVVYLFVQGGYGRLTAPVTVAFRSWSYFYPLGMVVAPFAHNGLAHLTGNLVGTVVLGTLAEYAWGHFPRERGTSTFASPLTNPYVRAFVAFPAGVVVVGLATSAFGWGPIIGFSGVVFAFAGFSLVRYPLGTVVALSADDVVRLIVRALQEPMTTAQAEPSFGRPWWVGIAIQGHLLGLFLGIVLGAVLLGRRTERPSATRVWAGALIAATSFALWAVWWFRGNAEYVLYRAPGVALVFALSLLVTVGLLARESDRTLLAVPSRQVAVLVLVFPILVVAFVAVPLNLTTVADAPPPNPDAAVTVRDYTVTYAENVINRQTSVVNLSAFGETTRVRASGVIVTSEDRHLWTRAASTGRLAFTGTVAVRVGGLGWRETVGARRRGWSVVDNATAYAVWLKPPGGEWRLAYLSDPVVAGPTLAGRRASIDPTDRGFLVAVARNGTVVRAPLPASNASVAVDGIRFVREGDDLYATYNETRVRVASRETYE